MAVNVNDLYKSRNKWSPTAGFDKVNAQRQKAKAQNKQDKEDEILKKQAEERRKRNAEQYDKKKNENKSLLETLSDLNNSASKTVHEGGKSLIAGMQQFGSKVPDVLLQGGDLVGELADTIEGKSEDEKNKRRETTQRLREGLHNKEDITGEKLKGTSGADEAAGNIAAGRGSVRDFSTVGGEALDTALAATMFVTPGGAAMRGAVGTGAKETAKRVGKEAALFGGLDAAAGTSRTYGETGDVGESLKQGAIEGLTSAGIQGGLGAAGYGLGRGVDDVMTRIENRNKVVEPEQRQLGAGDTTKQLDSGITTRDENGNIIAGAGEYTEPRQLEAVTQTGRDLQKRELNDLETELEQVRSGQYREEDWQDVGELRRKDVKALYEDPDYIAQRDELAKAQVAADEQLQYYNKMITEDPYYRAVDRLDNQERRILNRREAEYEQARQVANDPTITDPVEAEMQFNMLKQEIDARYAGELSKISEKHMRLAEKYPDRAAEAPMLHQAMGEATQAKVDADLALERLEQDSLARVQSQKALERTTQREQELTQAIEQKRQEVEQTRELFSRPAETKKEATQKADIIATGEYTRETHPHFFNEDGSLNNDAVKKEWKGTVDEVRKTTRREVIDKDPDNLEGAAKVEYEMEVVQDTLENTNSMSKTDKISAGILSSDETLRSLGANKLADKYEQGLTNAHRDRIHDRDLFKSLKDGTKSDTKDIFRAMDGNRSVYETLDDGGKKAVEVLRGWLETKADELGLPKDARITDYIPHIFNTKGGKLSDEGLAALKTIDGPIKKLKSYIETGNTKGLTKKQMDAADKLIDENPGKFIKDFYIPEEMLRIMKKNDKGDINNRFLKRRVGAEGFIEDVWQAVEAYSAQAARKKNLEPVTRDMAAIVEKTTDAKFASFLDGEIKHIRGERNGLDKWMDDHLPGSLAATRVMKHLISAGSLFGNVTSPINSAAQLSTVMTELGPKDFSIASVQANKMWADAATKGVLPADQSRFFNMMREDGVFEGDVASVITSDLKKRASQAAGKAGYAMLQMVDREMRSIAYIGGYNKAIREGASEEAARQAARRMSNKTNFNFSRDRVPPAFRSQVVKNNAALVTFVAPMMKYSVDVGINASKQAKRTASKMANGQKLNSKDFDEMAKLLYYVGSVAAVSAGINGVLSGGEDWRADWTKVVPNPLDENTYSTPAIQLFTGTDTQTGLAEVLAAGASGVMRGGKWSNEEKETMGDFAKSTLFDPENMRPGRLIPGAAQYNKTMDANEAIDKGISESKSGSMQFSTEGWDNKDKLNARLFGKYNSREGRDYLDSFDELDENGDPIFRAVSGRKRDKIAEMDPEDRAEGLMFFQTAAKLVNKTKTKTEIDRLVDNGQRNKAIRKAEEYNAKVDEVMAPYYAEYPDMADELLEELNKNLYVKVKKAK